MVKIKVVSDAGHAWGVVPVMDLHKAGLDSSSFTKFSYTNGPEIALEEDADLPKLMRALFEKGVAYSVREIRHVERSRIRDWPINELGEWDGKMTPEERAAPTPPQKFSPTEQLTLGDM